MVNAGYINTSFGERALRPDGRSKVYGETSIDPLYLGPTIGPLKNGFQSRVDTYTRFEGANTKMF